MLLTKIATRLLSIKKNIISRIAGLSHSHTVTYDHWESYEKKHAGEKSGKGFEYYYSGTSLPKEKFIKWLLADDSLDETINFLDIGCGPGVMCQLLNEHPLLKDRIMYTGIDQSEAALSPAKVKFANYNATFIQADLAKVDLPAILPMNSYDVIFVSGVVEHMPGYKTLIRKSLSLNPKVFVLTTFAVLPGIRRERRHWRSETNSYMNTYPYVDVYELLRDSMEGVIQTASFGQNREIEDYWFPQKQTTLFYCNVKNN